MDQHRISMADIILGEPLPWDVYDAGTRLLLRKGHVIEREQQIEALIERGLFVDAKSMRPKEEPQVIKQKEIVSILRLINFARKQLDRLLLNLHTESDAQPKLIEIAKAITVASNLNPDIALASILMNQTKGSYAVCHCIDTAIVCVLIAQALKKSQQEVSSLSAAALTMNVSMLRLQEQFQNKKEALSDQEKQLIRNHPQESANLLQKAGVSDPDWLSYVLLHHENEDGSGYPFGKQSIDIPFNAKILALADRYCARVSARNYRKSLLPNAALRDILLAERKNIDPTIAATFIKELGTYPTGTFVRLESGEIGVVTGRGSSTTTPFVHALIGPRGAPLSFPIKRDTSQTLNAIREVLSEEQASIRVSMQQLWGDEARL